MNIIEYIAQKYDKPLDWAQRFWNFAELMVEYHEVLQFHCEAGRDVWARAAVAAPSCNSPDYAYRRGRSDQYHEIPQHFTRFADELLSEHDRYEQEQEGIS